MKDPTYRSFAVAWNECQNSFIPEQLFLQKAMDFMLTKSDWLTTPDSCKKVTDIVKDRVWKKKQAARKEKEGKTGGKVKTKAKAAKKKKKVTKTATTKVKDREAIDLTNLEPDNSKQESSSKKSDVEKKK